jgi:hypothetical protein
MPSWIDLLNQITALPNDAAKSQWLNTQTFNTLQSIGARRGNRNVLFYSSAFLQKQTLPPALTQITHEDINGFMSTMHGLQWDRGLTLLMHTPGGVANAAEAIVQYLHSKFTDIEVVVPTFAMSAGTMISLAANRIVMGRQSQLGPIDPQLPIAGRYVSARAIVDQFDRAKREITGDLRLAHAWAPILQSLGPALLVEAQNALDYGERMVAGWLAQRMFGGQANASQMGDTTAAYFNDANVHKSHGRRIDRAEARAQNVVVEDLENNDDLQDDVLTAYHLMTIAYEQGPAAKMIWGAHRVSWIKNVA